ncbi:hypothetical protein D920_02903, partial [Enterococcus faecalis 13-SD-W-01]
VTLFTGLNGTGRSHVAVDTIDAFSGNLSWLNDNVVSLRLSPRSKVVVHEHFRFTAGFRTIVNSSNTNELLVNLPSDWLNRVSALQISSYENNDFGVNLFQNRSQGGHAISITEPHSDYDLARSGNLDNQISSIEVYPNSGIIVFDEAGLRGDVFAVYENRGTEVMHVELLAENPEMNDIISSYSAYRLN